MDLDYAKKIIAETASTYDHISSKFSQTRQHNWNDIKQLVDIHIQPGDSVVDLGCGNGRLISILPDKISYNGLDISAKLVEEAQKQFPQFKFQVGNLLSLPYPNNNFDKAVALASLNHIPSETLRQQAINEIHRILKPNGIFIMSNWNLDQDKYRNFIGKNPALESHDALIPWKDNQGNIIVKRYYHQFALEEIENLFSEFTLIDNLITDHNFITVAQKVD